MISVTQSAIDDICQNYRHCTPGYTLKHFARKYKISTGTVRKILAGHTVAHERNIKKYKPHAPDTTLQVIADNPGLSIGKIMELTNSLRSTANKRISALRQIGKIARWGSRQSPLYYIAGAEPSEPYASNKRATTNPRKEVLPMPILQSRRPAMPSDFKNFTRTANPMAWVVVQLGAQA